jgi:RNA polymerase sigma-70 factor (ECF subfamily)
MTEPEPTRADGPLTDELVAEVYDLLRGIAARMWNDQAASIQPTVLVHEAYLRLARRGDEPWESRAHLIAVAARAMRQILTDRARRRNAWKRGGHAQQVTLSGIGESDDAVDLLAVEAALTELEALDPRRAEVVTMRVIGGLSVAETAAVLGVSERTVKADWRVARAWLRTRLEGGAPGASPEEP